MKQRLLYEVKRLLLPLIIFSVMFCLISAVFFSVIEIRRYVGGAELPTDSGVALFAVVLCILSFVVAIMQFSYRMQRRSVDLWYSLPISRGMLALVRVIGGAFLLTVPYTLGFWTGVAVLAMRYTHALYIGYLLYYVYSLLMGIGLFGFFSFFFTRANNIADGIIFALGWSFLLALLASYLATVFDVSIPVAEYQAFSLFSGEHYTVFSPLAALTDYFGHFILGTEQGATTALQLKITIPIFAAGCAACCFGLFFCAGRDRAEHVEQNSSSLFGYRLLIPVYEALIIGCLVYLSNSWSYIFFALAFAAAFIFCIVYRRSFRLKRSDVISIVVGLLAGVLLALPNLLS